MRLIEGDSAARDKRTDVYRTHSSRSLSRASLRDVLRSLPHSLRVCSALLAGLDCEDVRSKSHLNWDRIEWLQQNLRCAVDGECPPNAPFCVTATALPE
jgi:hypothetical protein